MMFFTQFFQKMLALLDQFLLSTIIVDIVDLDTFLPRRVTGKQLEEENKTEEAKLFEEIRRDLALKTDFGSCCDQVGMSEETSPPKLQFTVELTEQQIKGLKEMVSKAEENNKETPEQVFARFIYIEIEKQRESLSTLVNGHASNEPVRALTC